MLARLHRLRTTAAQYEAGLKMVREDLLPWARESDGYCGALGLVNRETGEALLVTLWADDDTRSRSAEAAERLSSMAALASGADQESLENFEVSIIEVLAPQPSRDRSSSAGDGQ
ncbi:MAG TPA: hypothetical protein VNP93_10535 [Gaiellaceae bacterium]|nr:hypothetical protein [Gaiellaceae bacterium]